MNIEREKEILLDTDRAFSALSEKEGVAAAFAAYMTDDAVIFRDQAAPFVGREQIEKLFADYPAATLVWEPYKVELAKSGELGYTLGEWKFSSKDSDGNIQESKGHYVSIWRKQPDGSWKYEFDTGITAPE